MNCKKAERLLLQSFDGGLNLKEKNALDKHLEKCSSCEEKQKEYASILETLRETSFPEPLPYFWDRLHTKIKEQKMKAPWLLWEHWSIKAIPISMLIVTMFLASLILLFPLQEKELTQSELLLLQNSNPFQESQELLEEQGVENKNMRLIFTALDKDASVRRYFP